MSSAHVTSQGSSLSALLSLYMQGHITEKTWNRLMRLMDSKKTTKQERLALARYLRDVVSESGAGSLNMPRVTELGDMLAGVRTS